MFALWKKTTTILSAAALLSIGANVALAEEHNHAEHNHGAHAAETATLTLNKGKKWETDDNLRQSMARIRDALSAELHSIHSGKAVAKQYQALARMANEQLAFIVKNCKLEPEADTMLHLVLADIIAGADAMAGKDVKEARKGAEKIAKALDNYGAYFAHPGWDGGKHTH